MTDRSPPSAALAATLLLLLALGGCAGGAPRSAGDLPAPAAPARPAWTGQQDMGRVIALLEQGEAPRARKLLVKFLKAHPGDPIAEDLLRQIDEDPAALLGAESYPYIVKAGETLADLAGRFLGKPTSFYALGRYNQLAFPVTLAAGQVLRIPGEPKPAKPRPIVEKPRIVPPAPNPAPAPAPARPPSKPPAPKAAPAPPADPGRAIRLRAAALEQLNRGHVDQAVALLQRADSVAPGNPLVRRDLERAMRIRRTLHP